MQSIQGSSDAGQQSGMCRKNVIPLLVSGVQCGMNEPFPSMVLYNLQWAAHPEELIQKRRQVHAREHREN